MRWWTAALVQVLQLLYWSPCNTPLPHIRSIRPPSHAKVLNDWVQVLELLAEHLGQWSCSIAFPELAHLPLLHLRKFSKQCKVERFRTSSRALADALDRNMAFVTQRRLQVDFSPKDTAQVNMFLQDESAANQVSQP